MPLITLVPRLTGLVASHMCRTLYSSPLRHSGFTNILADDSTQAAVRVNSITRGGHIELANGLLLSGACIFLGGKVFLWDVPVGGGKMWDGWGRERFEIFDVVVPKPEILILGTGLRTAQLPPSLSTYLQQVGLQIDVMDTRNACSTYNLLVEEGRDVAAALLPLSSTPWQRVKSS